MIKFEAKLIGMGSVETILTYIFLFISIYLEIFILTTYFGRRKEIQRERLLNPDILTTFPSVTVIIPCFNEEKTVARTLDSLLALEYPKDKLNLIVVDDGSKDSTWSVISEYAKTHPQVEAIQKENGGKHTALNLGIEKSTSDLIGCLDADSFVDPKTLKRLVIRFVESPETMAVTPAVRVYKPRTVIQMIQSAEYVLGVLVKRIMSFLGAIHVTPGPFPIFRREVFQKIGLFRHAHNTEDLEIALRMHTHHLKIENVHNAWVYTVGPRTVKQLYKQRLRWTHGFLENSKHYKYLYFNSKYGNLGFLTLPIGLIFIFATVLSIFFLCYNILAFIVDKITQYRAVGFASTELNFSWFYFSTKLDIFLAVMLFIILMTLMLISRNLVEGKRGINKEIILFFIIYPILSPVWVVKSVYNTVFSKKTSWR